MAIAALSITGSFILLMPVYSQDRLSEMLIEARKAEGQDIGMAGGMYYSILVNDMGGASNYSGPNCGQYTSAPLELKRAVARRAAACLTIAANRSIAQRGNPGGDWLHFEEVNQLVQLYPVLEKLEPSNPTWPYLNATVMAAQGRYVECKKALQRSLKTTGTSSSVRQKAQTLLTHINPYANQDYAQMKAADQAALKALLSGPSIFGGGPLGGNMFNGFGLFSGGGGSSSSSSSSNESVPDWERRARNAEAAGDYGAASRFRSGGSTVKDSSNYW
jgi:hypothetical protein